MQPSQNQAQNLDKYGRVYPPKKGNYYVPSITTDAVVLRPTGTSFDILLITRKHNPFQGQLALPGGFLDYNEDPVEGCLRELKEETCLVGTSIELLTVAGQPERDPRGHTVSIVYLVKVDGEAVPVANDDADTATFYDIGQVLDNQQIAFDHHQIISLAYQKVTGGEGGEGGEDKKQK